MPSLPFSRSGPMRYVAKLAYMECLSGLTLHGRHVKLPEDMAIEVYSRTGVYSDHQLEALLTAMKG